MGALPPISPWIPEDDLLLKNSVEHGASLESLAKGAVRFSRRFTIRELQERWHALLYDPDISFEASERMMEAERAGSDLISNKSSRVEISNESIKGQKRKSESVRRCYYAMRKKNRNDPLNQGDLNFLVPPVENFYGHENEVACPGNILEDPRGSHFELGNTNFDGTDDVCPEDIRNNTNEASSKFDDGEKGGLENHLIEQGNIFEGNMYSGLEGNHVFNSPVSDCEASFHHLQYSSPPPAMPVWRNMAMAGDSHLSGTNPQIGDPFGLPDETGKSSLEYDLVHSETDFETHIGSDEMTTSQFDLVALSDTLLNISDDEMLLMDDDGKEIDKYGLSNLLLDSPSDMNEEDQILTVTQADTLVAPEADVCINSSTTIEQLDKGDNDVNTSGSASLSEEPKPSSASNTDPQVLELCKGVICCTLNTEVLEVPNNDHVIFPSKSRLSSLSRSFDEVSRRNLPMKGNLHKQASETSLSLVNRELKRFGELHTDSQARVNKMGLNHANECGPATSSCSTLIIKKTLTSEIVPQKQSLPGMPELPVKSSYGLKSNIETSALGKKGRQVLPAVKIKNLVVNSQLETADEVPPEAVVEPLLSDVEEELSDDNDDEIPYFSDIELMILDMDLAPKDLDSYSSRQVAMYESEDAKRAIIRWEQSARASRQREIASHGALAVLYGRHSKHYIKKAEVLIGRATEDVLVDIDLSKEGRANKISRRQAIIKMDEGGAFHLRNLGRYPILVGDKEVHMGQSLILRSNCLIEVREMPFIFELYEARIKQYLDGGSRSIPPK